MAAVLPLPVFPKSPTFEPPIETAKPVPRIRSNEGKYMEPEALGWMRPSPASSTSMEELHRRFDEEGYIWVTGLIPREDVLDYRESYFSHLAPTGILKPGTSPREGIFNPTEDPLLHHGVGGKDLPSEQDKVKRLVEAHTKPEYLQFIKHPSLRKFVREFMGWKNDVLVHRTLLRHNVPHGLSTGIHYDKIFLRAGQSEFLTAWVPIGDCKANGGGLMYLAGSSQLGMKMEQEFRKNSAAAGLSWEEQVSGFNSHMDKSGQLTQNAEEWGKGKGKWIAADYEAGDVVFHNPYLVHGAVKNEDRDGVIRLSTDLRFYEEGSDIDQRWMKHWVPEDGL